MCTVQNFIHKKKTKQNKTKPKPTSTYYTNQKKFYPGKQNKKKGKTKSWLLDGEGQRGDLLCVKMRIFV